MKKWFNLYLYFTLFLLFLPSPIQAAPPYPEFKEELILIDVSEKLDPAYLSRMEAQFRRYPFPVRAVFLPETQGTDLANYAEKLYKHWKLPSHTMLLVIALDRRKIGIHAGDDLKEQLKQAVPKKEIPLPSASPASPNPNPSSNASPEPSTQPEPSSHLDLLPEVVENMMESLTDVPAAENNKPVSGEPLVDSTEKTEPGLTTTTTNSEKTRRSLSFDWQTFRWFFVFLGLIGAGIGSWYGFLFWKRYQATRAIIDKYALNGQVVHGELERIYEDLESLIPDFHGYQAETHAKLKLFLKNITAIQDEFDAIFEEFEEQVANLASKQTQEDAIAFFKDLESKRDQGKSLLEQAQTVLENLTEISENNQMLLARAEKHQQSFSVNLHEIRKLHPALKLTKLYQTFQRYQHHLGKLQKQNAKDPIGTEKEIKDWEKDLHKLERDARSLPHLWTQFDEDLKKRISILSSRANISTKISPQQTRQLGEIQRLHQVLSKAIIMGDMEQLDKFNTAFTRKLQALEAEL